jgi:plasmid maintenance system antidote protein VapI
MHIDHSQLNHSTIGKFDVSAPFAKKLELSTGVSAEFWLNLQNTFDSFIHRNLSTNCEPLL